MNDPIDNIDPRDEKKDYGIKVMVDPMTEDSVGRQYVGLVGSILSASKAAFGGYQVTVRFDEAFAQRQVPFRSLRCCYTGGEGLTVQAVDFDPADNSTDVHSRIHHHHRLECEVGVLQRILTHLKPSPLGKLDDEVLGGTFSILCSRLHGRSYADKLLDQALSKLGLTVESFRALA